ncbi:NUDIX hydrolase [Sulfuriroseicoccus oceanibius]|uniref:GDP-mannose pyrophosphatase n=1 Tax=Sulfuriroseicoccus oceanibius TaxID=2707525 RepID=A0A6B3L4L2_9BACT|nr:NUDIX hydrolase [Sulfuriroseicoccus oceanibius]QQL45950.1 NUDIX hydrolase [Sulfuriroseicoccus oceanibius]
MKSFPTFAIDDCAPGWIRRKTESLYNGQYIQLENIHYRTPGRPDEDIIWTVARRKNAVIVAPQTSDGKFLMVRQERLPIQRTLWEFPAGQIDDTENKDSPAVIIETAHRELHEETHHHIDSESGELIPCGFYFSSQGFTDEHAYLFLARNVVKDDTVEGGLGEESECIHEARAFSLEEIRQMIADNVIIDANTLALFARMTAMRLIDP